MRGASPAHPPSSATSRTAPAHPHTARTPHPPAAARGPNHSSRRDSRKYGPPGGPYLLLSRLLEWFRTARGRRRVPVRTVVRVAGAVLLVALLGGWLAARAFGDTLDEPAAAVPAETAVPSAATLTFDRALELALKNNKQLKVSQEGVRAAEGRVAEARAAFLPSVDLSFAYTPAQQFPLIRIPAGIFGPDEQTFQAAFTRQNIMSLQLNQPLYTGGRLRNAYAIEAAGSEKSRLSLDRARQELTFQVVETFYRALLQDQGLSVARQGVDLAERQLALAKTRFEAGSAARFDVLRAEVDLANAKTTLIARDPAWTSRTRRCGPCCRWRPMRR